MKITNVKVYGLEESIVASGYPMLSEPMDEHKFNEERSSVEMCLTVGHYDNKHIQRAIKLAQAPGGSGHDNFLKGIIVQMDVNAPQYFWQQLQRYHFIDFISSMSKMHRIDKIADSPNMFDESTGVAPISFVYSLLEDYKDGDVDIDELLCNVPMGLEYSARMTTNYLQLKTIYKQRRHHRSRQWQVFCDWIESLPMASLLICERERKMAIKGTIFAGSFSLEKLIQFHQRREFMCNKTERPDEERFHHEALGFLRKVKANGEIN